MPTRLLALFCTVLLAASGLAGVALHVCQSMGGVAVGDCDCEKQASHEDHASHGAHHAHGQGEHRLDAQPCCSVELTEASPAVATFEASTLRVDDAPIAFVGLTGPVAPSSRLACDPALLRERAPPNVHGPPIFVRNCSFLN